ncbi:MAG: c-type cytochrome, partial [Chitinophagaceae bacterium]
GQTCISSLIFPPLSSFIHYPNIMKPQTLTATLIIPVIFISVFACTNNSGSTVKQEPDTTRVARGKYLVETVGSCMHCHSQRDFTKFSGPIKEDTKGMGGIAYPKFGTLYSSNITPDTATGIGGWTDDEIARAISLGIRENGDTLFPIMPYYDYNKMSKEDVYSIVAYLRTLKPIINKIPERKLKSPAGPEHDHYEFTAIGDNLLPAANDTIQTGEYLARVGACISCHTPKTEDDHMIADSSYAGGDMMGQKFGFRVSSPNITPDSATGIGSWTQTSFVDKFISYRNPVTYTYDPGKQNTIMPWITFGQMTDSDLKAIYAYLKTIKPIQNKVEKWAGK